MPTDLIVSEFNGHSIRSKVINGEAVCVAKDVCGILGISKYRDAIRSLDEDERVSIVVDTPGGVQEMQGVNKFGIHSLILKSNKPEAKAFKRWIIHEVLPSIEKVGSYSIPGTSSEVQQLREENSVLRLKTQILEEHTESEPLDYDEVASMLSEYMQPPFGPKHFRQWLAKHGIQTTANYKDDQPNRKYINRGWFRSQRNFP